MIRSIHQSCRSCCSVALVCVLLIASLTSEACALASFTQVKTAHRRSDALILDRHGEVIHEVRIDKSGRRLDWTELKDISPALLNAVLQSEDRNFYEHSGVDW